MEKTDLLESIAMLEKHEMALEYLYNTYAKKLPEFEEFWTDLATQERTHAFLIRSFRLLIEEGKLSEQAREFKTKVIEDSMKRVSGHMNYALRNDITIKDALDTAMEMEQGMVEKGLFTPKEGDPPELKKVLINIEDDTNRHFKEIKSLWDELLEA